MRRRQLLGYGAAAVALGALAACSAEPETGAPDGAAEAEQPSADTPMEDRQPPTLATPEGDPPTELLQEDLVEGNGDEATVGKQIDVHALHRVVVERREPVRLLLGTR